MFHVGNISRFLIYTTGEWECVYVKMGGTWEWGTVSGNGG